MRHRAATGAGADDDDSRLVVGDRLAVRLGHDCARDLDARFVGLGDARVGQPVQIVEPAVEVAALVEGGPFVAEQVPHLAVVVERDHGRGVDLLEERLAVDLAQRLGGRVVVEVEEAVGVEIIQTVRQRLATIVSFGGSVLDLLRSALVRRVGEPVVRVGDPQQSEQDLALLCGRVHGSSRPWFLLGVTAARDDSHHTVVRSVHASIGREVEEDRVYLIVVKFKTKPEWTDRWIELVTPFTEATRAEPGNLWFEWNRSIEEPDTFTLVEAFADDGAAAHVNSDHFKAGLRDDAARTRRRRRRSSAARSTARAGTRWASSRSSNERFARRYDDVVRIVMRSPGRPKMLRISAGASPVLPNQCGTVVSNEATSPGPSTQSSSPSTNRIRPDST